MIRLFAPLFYLLLALPAAAQWQVPNHAIPVGRGSGVSGFSFIAPGAAGRAIVSDGTTWGVSASPAIQTLIGGTGITVSAAGTVWTVGLSAQLTAGSVGTASRVPVLTFNAQGQLIFAADVALSASPFVTPGDFAIVCDGVTDWSMALQSMYSAASGKQIFFPAAPDCLTNTTLNVLSNTATDGAGRDVATIRGTGAANPVFSITSKNNVSFSNIACKGTDSATSWTVTNYGCFLSTQTSTVSDISGLTIRNMKFSGFNTNYWIYISATGANVKNYYNVEVSNNLVTSALADVPTDPVPNNRGNSFLTIFAGSAGSGQIINPVVQNNQIEGDYLCGGIAFYSNVFRPTVRNNRVNKIGAVIGTVGTDHCINGTGDAHNAYGILFYDFAADGNPPFAGIVQGNTTYLPWAAGMYFVGDGNPAHTSDIYNSWLFLVSGNLVVGQLSDEDSTLARGGIVVTNATNFAIKNNSVYNSFGGITVGGQFSGSITVEDNDCITGVVSATSTVSCIRFFPGIGTNNTTKFLAKTNNVQLLATGATSGSGIFAVSTTSSRFQTLEISDNSVFSQYNGISLTNQFVNNSFVLKGNVVGGPSANWMMNVSGNTGAPVNLTDNILDSAAGVAGYGLVAQNSTIQMSGSKFVNRVSGVVPMFRADGTCGTIVGTVFSNVVQAAQVQAGSLGTTNPSGCTLNYMEQVQNLTPSELGSGGFGTANQKYVVDRWSHISTAPSTVHLEQRVLTGN